MNTPIFGLRIRYTFAGDLTTTEVLNEATFIGSTDSIEKHLENKTAQIYSVEDSEIFWKNMRGREEEVSLLFYKIVPSGIKEVAPLTKSYLKTLVLNCVENNRE